MTRVDRTVHQIILRTADLQKLDATQRQLVLTLGHVANEMTAFYRAAYAAGMEARAGADPITQQIARSQTLLMLRMAASKMHELFNVVDDPKFGKVVKRTSPSFNAIRKDIKEKIRSLHGA